MNTKVLTKFFLATLLSAAIAGCESSDESDYNVTVGKNNGDTQATATTTQSAATSTQQRQQQQKSSNTNANTPQKKSAKQPSSPQEQPAASANDTPTVGDAVSYGALRWSYGGMSAGGAKQSSVTISGLRMSRNGLSFSWGTNLSAWGLANNDAGAYACLFVEKNPGSYVGGKFDWISSSRTSRGFENIFGNYAGWNLDGVPNPCNVAFVIVSGDKKKRSNVLTGSWLR